MARRNITVDRIKEISGESFEPGRELFGADGVIRARIRRDILRARVCDDTTHVVRVDLDPSVKIFSCTCDYPRKVCRHVVAALLHLQDNLPKMLRYERHGGSIADHLVEGLPDGEMGKFGADQIAKDRSAFGRLTEIFGKEEIAARMKCTARLDGMFSDLYHTHGWTTAELDFGAFFRQAEAYRRKGNYRGAAYRYQGISEAIADNMELVDDSNGYYGDMFQEAVRRMTNCIKDERAGRPQKRQYISYLHERFVQNDPDYFQEFYDGALRRICTTQDDLWYLRDLHEPLVPDHIPDRDNFSAHYGAAVMVEMMVHILKKLHDPLMEDMCKKHYRSSPEICRMYVRALAKRDLEMARQVAEEAKSLFPWERITVPRG